MGGFWKFLSQLVQPCRATWRLNLRLLNHGRSVLGVQHTRAAPENGNSVNLQSLSPRPIAADFQCLYKGEPDQSENVMRSVVAILSLLASACAQEKSDWIAPAVEHVTCEEWAEVSHQGVIYFNNVWNVQAAGEFDWKQCIVRDPNNAARLGFYWKWPDSGEDIFAQPQAKLGVSPWDPLPKLDQRFPLRIGDIEAMRVATDVTVDGPSEYNVVTTLWLTDTGEIGATPQPHSIVAEVMLWTYATDGHLSPAGTKVGLVVHDGVEWDVWLDENWRDVSGANDNRWAYIAFVARAPGYSAAFDPVALLRSKSLSHLELDEAYIADVELGSEIMQGEGLLWINRFNADIKRR